MEKDDPTGKGDTMGKARQWGKGKTLGKASGKADKMGNGNGERGKDGKR